MPATILITSQDRPVPEANGRWKRGQILLVNDVPYTTGGEADLSKFYQFTITDKTPAEVDAKFFAPYNRDIQMSVVSGPNPAGRRVINCRNANVNATGTKGQWTVAGTDEINAEWNARYPTAGLFTVSIFQGTNPDDTYQCDGTFTTGQAAEFEALLVESGLDQMDYRRLWFINETGMTQLDNNSGLLSGTAAQLSNWVEDYRVTT